MILLGIDTCGREGSLALVRLDVANGQMLSLGNAELAGRSTAAALVPAIGKLLTDAGLRAAEFEGIVVVDGPGSFTGIRIGLSTAKGLSEALAIPLFAISRIAVLSALHEDAWVLLDAGRDEFYAGHRAAVAAAGVGGLGDPDGPDRLDGPSLANEWLIRREDALHLEQIAGTLCQCCRRRQYAAPVTCEEKVATALAGVRLVAAPSALQSMEVALPEVLAGRHADTATLDGRYVRRLEELYGQTQPVGPGR